MDNSVDDFLGIFLFARGDVRNPDELASESLSAEEISDMEEAMDALDAAEETEEIINGVIHPPDFVYTPFPVLAPFPIFDFRTEPPIPVPTPAPPCTDCPVRKPRKCEDIKTVYLCRRAKIYFGFECLGWGGESCVPADGMKCSDYVNPVLCNRARGLGANCVGWTGWSGWRGVRKRSSL